MARGTKLSIGLPQPRSYVFDEVFQDPTDPDDSPAVLVTSSILLLQRHFGESGDQLFGAADWTVSGLSDVQLEQVGQTFVPSGYYFETIDESAFMARGVLRTGAPTGPATVTTSVGGTFAFEVVDLSAVESVAWVDVAGSPLPARFVFADQSVVEVNVVPSGPGGKPLFGEGMDIQVTTLHVSPRAEGSATLLFEWAGFQYSMDFEVLSSAIPSPSKTEASGLSVHCPGPADAPAGAGVLAGPALALHSRGRNA